jgi:transposase
MNPIIIIEHLEDAPRSSRPTLQTWERTRELIREVIGSKKGRNLSMNEIGAKLGVSRRTVYRMLRKEGFKLYKELSKPGLTKAMMKAQLEFCKAYEHWTLEDWKRVIWTDETSIILGHRRGSYRIWRRP